MHDANRYTVDHLCVSESMSRSKYKPYFAWKMAEEYAVNIEPHQFKPMASESAGESSDDSSDNNTYDVNKERIGQVEW